MSFVDHMVTHNLGNFQASVNSKKKKHTHEFQNICRILINPKLKKKKDKEKVIAMPRRRVHQHQYYKFNY